MEQKPPDQKPAQEDRQRNPLVSQLTPAQQQALKQIQQLTATLPEGQRKQVQLEAVLATIPDGLGFDDFVGHLTDLSHQFREGIAARLQEPLTKYLRREAAALHDEAKNLDAWTEELGGRRASARQKELAEERKVHAQRKIALADKVTGEILDPLSLGIRWGESDRPCYLAVVAGPKTLRGEFRIIPKGASHPVKTSPDLFQIISVQNDTIPLVDSHRPKKASQATQESDISANSCKSL